MGMKYHVIEEELAEGPALRQPIMHNIMGVMLSVKMRIDHVILPQSGQGKRINVICTFNHVYIENQVITTNGTAVEGVCVTGAASRPLVPFVGRELSRWQAGMAQYLPSRCARALSRSRYK